jgi:hypothetical protein
VRVARPLSVSVYAPLSRSCAMNPRMAMDCIACAVMPTAPWSVAVATQNKITRSCALSVVVSFHGLPASLARRLPKPMKEVCNIEAKATPK